MWTGVALAPMTATLGDEADRVAQVRVVICAVRVDVAQAELTCFR